MWQGEGRTVPTYFATFTRAWKPRSRWKTRIKSWLRAEEPCVLCVLLQTAKKEWSIDCVLLWLLPSLICLLSAGQCCPCPTKNIIAKLDCDRGMGPTHVNYLQAKQWGKKPVKTTESHTPRMDAMDSEACSSSTRFQRYLWAMAVLIQPWLLTSMHLEGWPWW